MATKSLMLAEIENGQRRPAEALRLVHQALRASGDAAVRMPAALLLIALREEDEAQSIGRSFLKEGTARGRSYARIIDALIAFGQDRGPAAVETLRSALEEDDYWLLRLLLGFGYLKTNRYAEGAEQLQMCRVRQDEAAMLFDDSEPTLRYVALLDELLARGAAPFDLPVPAAFTQTRTVAER